MFIDKMLRDRGYTRVADLTYRNQNDQTVIVLFKKENCNKETLINELVNIMKNYIQEYDLIVYVVTNQTYKIAMELENREKYQMINFIDQDFLMYDPTENFLVPKHTKIDPREIPFRSDDLPAILQNDPICKWYDFRKGDVLRITRQYEHGTETYYRIVV
jgi:DNA-directed RNA polymerase subunit H (RpoH/RPB5)